MSIFTLGAPQGGLQPREKNEKLWDKRGHVMVFLVDGLQPHMDLDRSCDFAKI